MPENQKIHKLLSDLMSTFDKVMLQIIMIMQYSI